MDRKAIEDIIDEEYETFSQIYRSIKKKELPKISLDDIVEECFLASHEEIVKSNEKSLLRAYALSVAARLIQRLKKEL